jgi:hypothetical protein
VSLTVDNNGSASAGDIYIDARDRLEITNSNISADGDLEFILVGSNSTPQAVVISDSNLTTSNSIATGVDANTSIASGYIYIGAIDEISILNSRLQAQTTRRVERSLS